MWPYQGLTSAPRAISRLIPLISLVLVALAAATASPAADFWFEAESAAQANRIHDAGGSESIHATVCSGASGGMAVQGLDFPGDWIEFDLTLSDRLCFVDSLRCAALVGGSWFYRVLFIPSGETVPLLEDVLPEIRGRGIS